MAQHSEKPAVDILIFVTRNCTRLGKLSTKKVVRVLPISRALACSFRKRRAVTKRNLSVRLQRGCKPIEIGDNHGFR